MIDDAGQEIELGMWYRLLEEKQDLLAEVKRLRKYNYKLKRFVENIEWGLNEINNEYKEIKEVIE